MPGSLQLRQSPTNECAGPATHSTLGPSRRACDEFVSNNAYYDAALICGITADEDSTGRVGDGWPSLETWNDTVMKPRIRCWLHGCNGRSFSHVSNYRRHCREKEGSNAEMCCRICGRRFTRMSALRTHRQERRCRLAAFDANGVPFPQRIGSKGQLGINERLSKEHGNISDAVDTGYDDKALPIAQSNGPSSTAWYTDMSTNTAPAVCGPHFL